MKVKARFDDLNELKRLFDKDFPVIGIGVTAFPRSALGYLLTDYKILCLLETKDLEAIKHLSSVVSLEKDLKAKFPEKFNTSEILQLTEAKKWLMENGKGLFLYKASTRSSRLAKEMGLKVLSTPGEIRKVFENKKEFRVEGKKAGINLVKGETLLVDDLDEKKWEEFNKT